MISVSIKYKEKRDVDWKVVDLLPSEYFIEDQDEPLHVDSVPLYDHAIDYLDVSNIKEIFATKIAITDTESNDCITITETYWNELKHKVIERVDSGNHCFYNEMIIQSQISDSPVVNEIIRLVRQQDHFEPVYHGYITKNSDGSESEKKVML